MFTVTINGDTRIIEKLNKLAVEIQNPSAVLQETGDMLIQEFTDNFSSEGGRLDTKWAQLSQATLIQKARAGYGGKGILVRTGKMRDSFTKETQKYLVRVFNPTSYYIYHQLGTKYMPQRVMIKATERIKQEVVAIFNKAITKVL